MAKDIGNSLQVTIGSSFPTYKAILFDVVPYTAATDVINVALASTAQVALYITRVYCSYDATAASTSDVYLVRRITANTSGTPTTLTTTQQSFLSGQAVVTQHDTSDQATQATVVAYASSPTLGTANIIDAAHIGISAIATPSTPCIPVEMVFGTRGSKLPVIRPGQSVSVSLGGNVVPAGAGLYLSLEWIEVPLISVQ